MSKENDVDINVVGWHGAKGPKVDSTVMGSAVSHLSENCPCPVLIIKNPLSRENSPEGCFRFAVCVDGSQVSKDALNLVMKIK